MNLVGAGKHSAVRFDAVSVQHGTVIFGVVYLLLCHACIHMGIYGVKSDGTIKFTHGAITFGILSEVQICKFFRGIQI